MATLEKDLRAALLSAATERPVQRWLGKNPLVLSAALGGIAYPNKVVSQFKFGSDYIADFVAMGAYSGALCVHLVELEPPGVRLFTKAGVPAKHLNTALSQVANWRTFVEKNRPAVLLELGKAFKQRELVFGRGTEPTDTTGMPLHDPRQQVTWHYHVAIGRRAGLSREELERRNALLLQTEVNVMTYDRLLELAKAVDDAGEAPYFQRPTRRMSLKEVWDGLKKQAKAGKPD
jgi:hypothetical protein